MNILMLTNTYKPHVGGVARSVEAFAAELRRRGHRVLVVTPSFEGTPAEEVDVIRVPAIQKFNGSDFSVRLPIPGYLTTALQNFRPDVVHSNHPFLLGDTALRIAAMHNVPVVFQHHTMYERYTHYVPGDSPLLQRFVIELSTEYANLCDHVIAPSESVAAVLHQRGVEPPISVAPTGVDVAHFAHGDGRGIRDELGIPADAFVVGHLGRLAPEKNLEFLAQAVALFLRKHPQARFLLVGTGPSVEKLRAIFAKAKVSDRVHWAGTRTGQALVDSYHAMDLFAFASTSETQGMVLTEAMAAGCPVVALDAPGAREVVGDRINGRLLSGPRVGEFAEALAWVARLDKEHREAICRAARQTAEEFSMPRCTERLIGVYQTLVAAHAGAKAKKHSLDDSLWQTSVRRFEAEWRLWSAMATAARTAMKDRHLWKVPSLFGRLVARWRRFRQAISRSEWDMRLLGYSRSEGTATEPGLVLIQIDGLSRPQLEHALEHRRLPFLRRLLKRERYRLHSFYSGVPSSTPAVQGEMFYGVKTAVPAFSFRDHETDQPAIMFEPGAAAKVQRRLAAEGRALLERGAAYSDIYSGGADEAHFCPATLGWGDLARLFHPVTFPLLLLLHCVSVLRIGTLLTIEFFLAIFDCLRGLISGQDLKKELKFIPTRVGIAILLRELLTIGASMDAARGLPVIHLNLLGYDEQAHRRGPDSAFAQWSLSGIDGAIRRIWSAARRSARRDYQVWIYSDHGQEETVPYKRLHGETIDAAVARILEGVAVEKAPGPPPEHGVQLQRLRWLGGGWLRRLLFGSPPPVETPIHDHGKPIYVAAMGSLGHIYPARELTGDERDPIARRLVDEAKIPMVLAADGPGEALVWNTQGQLHLPQDAAAVLGADHPFLEEAARDLVAVCHHPDAGPLVIAGWRPGEPPITFALENGAHGGPGSTETHGFALLPKNAPLPSSRGAYVRPLDFRHAVFQALGRTTRREDIRHRQPSRRDTLRILTYNVHSCVGLDRRQAPERIARLIAQHEPDVVALQELQLGQAATGAHEQAYAIAHEFQVECNLPTVHVEADAFGNAVFSRLPLRLVRSGQLPSLTGGRYDPRGAMWVAVEVDGQDLQLLNTHLGIPARERALQVETLLSNQWLADPGFHEPRVVCGDFNTPARSRLYRRICRLLRDAQLHVDGFRPRPTFPTHYPLGRIDHVFVGRDVEVVGVEVPSSKLSLVASDHLPVLVEVRLKAEKPASEESVVSPV
ncbi:MAG: glycosyltransferase [Thermoguttaceae bacterium]